MKGGKVCAHRRIKEDKGDKSGKDEINSTSEKTELKGGFSRNCAVPKEKERHPIHSTKSTRAKALLAIERKGYVRWAPRIRGNEERM